MINNTITKNLCFKSGAGERGGAWLSRWWIRAALGRHWCEGYNSGVCKGGSENTEAMHTTLKSYQQGPALSSCLLAAANAAAAASMTAAAATATALAGGGSGDGAAAAAPATSYVRVPGVERASASSTGSGRLAYLRQQGRSFSLAHALHEPQPTPSLKSRSLWQCAQQRPEQRAPGRAAFAHRHRGHALTWGRAHSSDQSSARRGVPPLPIITVATAMPSGMLCRPMAMVTRVP